MAGRGEARCPSVPVGGGGKAQLLSSRQLPAQPALTAAAQPPPFRQAGTFPHFSGSCLGIGGNRVSARTLTRNKGACNCYAEFKLAEFSKDRLCPLSPHVLHSFCTCGHHPPPSSEFIVIDRQQRCLRLRPQGLRSISGPARGTRGPWRGPCARRPLGGSDGPASRWRYRLQNTRTQPIPVGCLQVLCLIIEERQFPGPCPPYSRRTSSSPGPSWPLLQRWQDTHPLGAGAQGPLSGRGSHREPVALPFEKLLSAPP